MDQSEVQSATGESERRRFPRVCEDFLIRLRRRWGSRSVMGRVVDYDLEGLRIRTQAEYPAGAEVLVDFNLPKCLSTTFRGLRCRFPAVVRQARNGELVVRWSRPLGEMVSAAARRHRLLVGSAMLLVIAVLLWTRWVSLEFFWYTPVVFSYSLILGTFFMSRFILSAMHKSPNLTGYQPVVSVVISVRNDEDAIVETVETCYRSDYPAEKFEVVVVNDGSTDKTLSRLHALQRKYPQLKVASIPPRGKRHGMAAGVRLAKGEIVVFVDSDTFLYPTALKYIVCGFEDPTLGASSGLTEVANADANALTKLQEVRYLLSFKLLKTCESLYNCVTCCPGCLSAYRRSYLLEVLDPWLNQRFLGAEATFGDDRSLTNFILRRYRVIYNEFAVASTISPETWGRYLRQQVRWKKSWLRETLIASTFMWKKHPVAAISFYGSAICSLLSPLMVWRAFAIELFWHDSMLLYYVTGLMLLGFLQCLYYLYRRPNAYWLFGMLMVVSQAIVMGPQTYYAMLTMRKNHWGTR